MKKLQFWIGLAAAITVVGCQQTAPESKGNTAISGQITDIGTDILVLEALGNQVIEVVDTLDVSADGSFEQKFDVQHSGFYRLKLSDQNFVNFIAEPKDSISIVGNGADLGDATFTGSRQTPLYHSFLAGLDGFVKRNDSINQQLRMAQATKNVELFQQARQADAVLKDNYRTYVVDFVQQNAGDVVSIVALSKLSPEMDKDVYASAVQAMAQKEPESPYYKSFAEQLKEASKLAIGAPAPEIALPSPTGEIVPLSSLKGKYVLLDFWASWCKPCRAENPNVVRMYNKYKDKGFEIYSVSLDKQKNQWELAIAKDGLSWTHVSDLQFWQSSVVPLYNVEGIPLTFLLDPDGNIVAKNLRGPSLEAKLAEIFG